MKMSRFLSTTVLVVFAGAAFAQDAVLMQVGNVQVTERDVMAELQRVPPEARASAVGSPQTMDAILKNLMARRLLTREAEADGLVNSPLLQTMVKIGTERVLSDARMVEFDKANEPDAATLEAYARTKYQGESERFQVPAQTHARHILVTGDDAQAEAEKLRAQILAGASFESVAKEYSKDPGSAAQGGDLGFFPTGRMVPEFDAAIKALKPSEISEPVKTQFGWHLIQVVETRPAGKRPFEEVRAELESEARTRVLSEKRKAKANGLLEKAEYKQDAIKAFVEKTH